MKRRPTNPQQIFSLAISSAVKHAYSGDDVLPAGGSTKVAFKPKEHQLVCVCYVWK
jgi:hypothetical protein